MGCVGGITFDRMPKQGALLGQRVKVYFHYNTDASVGGTCIRDDVESPGVQIFTLDDTRVVLSTECQYTPEGLMAKGAR